MTQESSQSIMWIQFPLSDQNVSLYIAPDWEKDKIEDMDEELEEDYEDEYEEDVQGGQTNQHEPASPSFQLKQQWRHQQLQLASQLILQNQFDWQLSSWGPNPLRFIGGVDISFAKGSKVDACATVTILSYPSLSVVWEAYSMVKLKLPYIPGLLAFREVPFILDILERLKKEHPNIMPQVLMVDGNGILHMRGFGQACHLGVLSGIPCVGVAKKLLYADGITNDTVTQAFQKSKDKNQAELFGASGVLRAVALKVRHSKGSNIIYVSPGHKIDMKTSVDLVKATLCGNPLPEPVYQADFLSRKFLELNYENNL